MINTSTPTTASPELDRFSKLLREMFQLDKPELDFGLYRIMHAKAEQIGRFMEEDLIEIVRNAFGEVDAANLKEAQAAYDAAVEQAKKYGAPDPEATEGAVEAKKALQQVRDGGRAETDIYDHLYRFFERYYDKGDFMSRRYYARESDSRAAPYAVPYDGREVYLHWANKDQYYIKSSEYLTNFRFDARQALEQAGKGAIDLQGGGAATPLPVRFTIAHAAEGEHNNVKAAVGAKREFIPLLDNPVTLEDGVLVLNFEYKPLPDGYPFDEAAIKAKYGAINKGQMPENWMADVFLAAIAKLGEAAKPWQQALQALAPTAKQKKRTLLARYIDKYTARNTMDYFIHKDLGRFLRRELDFYIKNEIMQLDNIENDDAPRVESWLARIKVIRRIGHRIIAMLAQLEDFQKKLWLKKKFVTETNYCITLDRVPEELYDELVKQAERMVVLPKGGKKCQRGEWVDLFTIDELEGYRQPLTPEFLKAHPSLVLDTAFFDADFKARLLAAIPDLDAQCDGLLVHSENFQALNLLKKQVQEQVQCVYIDPPYNTEFDRATGKFLYKDGYDRSTWAALLYDRVAAGYTYISMHGTFILSLDDNEQSSARLILDNLFTRANFLGTIATKSRDSVSNDHKISLNHNYQIIYAKNVNLSRFGGFPLNPQDYKNSDNDARGPWKPVPIDANKPGGDTKYAIMNPNTGERYFPPNGRSWAFNSKRYDELFSDGRITFGVHGTSAPKRKLFINERIARGDVNTPISIWNETETTKNGTTQIVNCFGYKAFSYPKPVGLLHDLIRISYLGADITVLDYFAGSGTTGHAVINLNREDDGHRKYILVEMGDYFDTVLKPRIEKVVYAKDWKDGKPKPDKGGKLGGVSHCFKYIRLESYEDTLNNLVLHEDAARDKALQGNPDLRRDYLLHYFLDTETRGSQSLLNIAEFRDPTAYKLKVKAPGSDVQVEKNVDLVETFNWLIGLWVEHLAAPQTLRAEFTREKDPELPEDETTRLVCTKLRPDEDGEYWFRRVEGYVLKTPGDENSKSPVLVIWRKLTIDPERDNAALQKYLETIGISTREKVYDTVYVNGSHTLPNPVVDGESTRVQLLEEAFHRAMWAGASPAH